MILINLLDLYSLVVLVAVILSWIELPYGNPVGALVRSLTEPLLEPIRRVVPPVAGLDFSPMVLLIALRVVRGVLVSSL